MNVRDAVVAYLGFGGNIGPSADRILLAWEFIKNSPIIKLEACSKLYRTTPVGGPPGQGDYINAVCRIVTTLSPSDLLDQCLAIEALFGRQRLERWGPRTLDIDLLIYDDLLVDEPGLHVPHPRLRERLFVLVPLADVAPLQLKLRPGRDVLEDVLGHELSAANETVEDWRNRVVG